MLRRIRQHWKNYIGNSRMALIGCTILGIWIVLAVAVPLFGPWSYSEQNAEIRNQGASLLHWFGTDRFGRDLLRACGTEPGSAWLWALSARL